MLTATSPALSTAVVARAKIMWFSLQRPANMETDGQTVAVFLNIFNVTIPKLRQTAARHVHITERATYQPVVAMVISQQAVLQSLHSSVMMLRRLTSAVKRALTMTGLLPLAQVVTMETERWIVTFDLGLIAMTTVRGTSAALTARLSRKCPILGVNTVTGKRDAAISRGQIATHWRRSAVKPVPT